MTPASPAAANKEKEGRLKRRTWLPGGHSRHASKAEENRPQAWIYSTDGKRTPYDLGPMLNAQPVPELWDDNGDTKVYLYPRTSGKGPSFRVNSDIYASSAFLTELLYGRIYSSATVSNPGGKHQQQLEQGTQNLSLRVPSTPPMTPENRPIDAESSNDSSKGSRDASDLAEPERREIDLFLPLKLSTDGAVHSPVSPSQPQFSANDLDTLLTVRNTFAFLVGGSLVATERRPTIFHIFMKIAELLDVWKFSNLDASTYGEAAASSFDTYVDELQLDNVSSSHEKTIEGIVLGERMKSVKLYNEAFVHGVGKYEELLKLDSPKFPLISAVTRSRMERASMDLHIRIKNIETRLLDFDFPSVFSGIMNSKTADERKVVRFEQWKSAFLATRKHFMSYYKHKYGSWPPKASSKKNDLETSGLNRLVLKDLYHDFSQLYDLLVDRKSLTTRTSEATIPDDDEVGDPIHRSLRRVENEYDHSSPPVQPPIPFDVPILPSLVGTRAGYGADPKKDAKARHKKLKSDEVNAVLMASHNQDAAIHSPCLDSFYEFERKSAHGRTVDELCEHRVGQWIFLYVVLQSLPMLVEDAPGVRWSRGVEYFLCEPPRSGIPWARDPDGSGAGGGVKRSWYGIAGSSGVVSLPSDIVEHGVEGVYRRSHAWRRAEQWSAHSEVLGAAVNEVFNMQAGPLLQPSDSRSSSPGRAGGTRSNRESVMMLGLEALPLPAGVAPPGGASQSRPQSSGDPSKTFDAIIGSAGLEGGKKKKK
ncbi:hypothetical protein BDY21DRAFT_277319 [Lineolata rhizophorae]|uniref:DUF8004 domain-containing protein n=1 Tax=Lineolata rhizophorae TaxID=578093 RepID=A0A6A6PDN0_9PEZI|nr:hypothetical protein BDY21DRAFT_277319 [Lineolata rhizophorae]